MKQTIKKSINLFLVEDHPVMRQGLKMMLVEHGYNICGETSTANEAIDLLPSANADIAILDLSLNGETAFSMIAQLRKCAPTVIFIVYSMHDSPLFVENAFHSGVKGYVTKADPVESLIEAIENVIAGKTYLCPTLANNIEQRFLTRGSLSKVLKELSDREMQVLTHIGSGFGCKEIAEKLNVNSRTIETYFARLKAKLGVANNRELVREAINVMHPN